MTATAASPRPREIISRVLAGVAGGWLFSYGLAGLAIALQVAAGSAYDEAHAAAMLFALVVYLAAFLWAFAARSERRVWIVLAGGGGAATLAAWLLGRALA